MFEIYWTYFKDAYELDWCDLCQTAKIICPECGNSSCNAASCPSCSGAFESFLTNKTTVESYLTPEEVMIYQKGLKVREFIIDSLAQGQSSINWKKLKEDGKFSQHTEEMFKKEIDAI